ncbi:MAG: hypothetical protein AAF483_21755 [Planctomycetota bacterium]
MLSREEYVEQAYFFGILLERLGQNLPLQELLQQSKFELLASTKLPLAIDLMLSELKHKGLMSSGMKMLGHYFMPFQTYLMSEAELDVGKFDYRTALQILGAESKYRSIDSLNPQGLFFFQFEAISRNRLNYDRGLHAVANDGVYSQEWKDWILIVRKQLGIIDLADMIYVRSEFYKEKQNRFGEVELEAPILFGMAEGKIAFANRKKDPLFLFSAMQRHLGYPSVPRLEPPDPIPELVPQLLRRIERLESRLKLMEEEQQGGIDITKFYEKGNIPKPSDELFGT